MRRELFLSFLLVIICVAGITWFVSSRTASDEFARLITNNTEQILMTVAFTAQDALQNFSTWEAWQAALDEQQDKVQSFLEFPLDKRIEQQIYLGTADSSITASIFFSDEQVADDLIFEADVLAIDELSQDFFDGDDIDDLLFDLLVDLEINNQQLLVVDNTNTVVVDSQGIFLNQTPPNLNTYPYAIILGGNDEPVARLYLVLQNDFYSAEQIAFLENTQRGNLYGALIGTVIALVLAIIFANQIIGPVRLLNQAMLQVSKGQWGHKVENFGRHEIREIGQTFNQLSHNLLEQQILRTRLVNDIAHEINTPLNLIRLEIESLVSGLQSPEEAHLYLNQEIDTLSHLLNDLIFLANERSSRTMDLQSVRINDLVAQTVQRFSVVANQSIRFVPAHPPIILKSNPILIERALSNLISNAVRYTPSDGEIIITIEKQSKSVEISVSDTGIGIDDKHLSHIFERFYRVDDARRTVTGGRGLGLAICKEIMQQLNGEILVESIVGTGSTFKLIFDTQ